jgi:hypothetical protein
MKKVLLLAAVALGFSAVAQDAVNARLMQAELPVSSAAREKNRRHHLEKRWCCRRIVRLH